MNRVNKVLLATDFSEASQNALDHAAVIAAKNDAELVVMHVRVPLDTEAGPEDHFPERDAYQKALEKASDDRLQGVTPRFEVPITRVSERGLSESETILSYVDQHGVDLIVTGTRARRGVAYALLGSVAEEIVRRANVPVLVVGTGAGNEVSAQEYKKIVVPVDFSETSKRTLKHGVAVAAQHGAHLVATHVIERVPNPAFYLFGRDSILEFFPDLHERSREAVQKMLDDSGEKIDAEVVITEGKAHKRVTDMARELDADLIVVGTAGHSGVDRFLLGSVTEKILRTSPCPVLTVRGEEPANV